MISLSPSILVRTLPGVGSVSRDAWNALFPSTAEDWDFFRSCEYAPPDGFSVSALGAFADGQLIGAIPVFSVKFPLDMAIGPRLRAAAAWLSSYAPALMNPAMLAIGSPQADECPIGMHPSLNMPERRQILAALLKGLSDHAGVAGISILAVKDLRDRDALWAHAPLAKSGFSRLACLPVAVLELPFRNENEYFGTFSPKFRSELRRKMRQASEVATELRTNIDDVWQEVAELFQETRKYRRADYGSFDDVSAPFFREVVRNMNGRAQVMLCRHRGQIVSFNMFLIESDRLLAKYIGMRYPIAHELNLYYFNWLMMVRYCISHGIRVMQSGQTSYETKIRLGSKLTRSWIYYRHRGGIANQLFRAIAPLASLERADPDLRNLSADAPYLPADYLPGA